MAQAMWNVGGVDRNNPYDPRDPRYSEWAQQNLLQPSRSGQQGQGGVYNKQQAQQAGMTDPQYQLGDLWMQSGIMEKLLNDPNYADLLKEAQKGMTGRTQEGLNSLNQQRSDLLSGGQFGSEQADVYKGLISGAGLGEAGNVINKNIIEKFRGSRDASRADLASRGFGPGGGDYGLASANIGKAQDEAYANALMQHYLTGVQTGTSGLQTMEQGSLGRNQLAGNIGMFTTQLPEQVREFGLGYGLDLTQAQQSPLLSLLLGSQQARVQQQSTPNAFQQTLGGLGQLASYFTPMGAMSGLGSNVLDMNKNNYPEATQGGMIS